MFKHIATSLLALAAIVPASAQDASELLRVQQDVNLSVEFVAEDNGRDKWRIPSINGMGDCEDFALLKRKLLIERGWDANDLSLIIVFEKGANFKSKIVEGHVALYVKSHNVVLDVSPDGAKFEGLYPQGYQTYMKRNNYAFYCWVDNIDTKKQFRSAGERCQKRKEQSK